MNIQPFPHRGGKTAYLRRLVRALRTGSYLSFPLYQIQTMKTQRHPARPPSLAELEAEAATFNRKSPVGTWIAYRDIMPEGNDPGTPSTAYRVKSEAYVNQGHTAVVFLEGKSGFVCVSHCRRVLWAIVEENKLPFTPGRYEDPDTASLILQGEPERERLAIHFIEQP